jgi:hypothetical protein
MDEVLVAAPALASSRTVAYSTTSAGSPLAALATTAPHRTASAFASARHSPRRLTEDLDQTAGRDEAVSELLNETLVLLERGDPLSLRTSESAQDGYE